MATSVVSTYNDMIQAGLAEGRPWPDRTMLCSRHPSRCSKSRDRELAEFFPGYGCKRVAGRHNREGS